VNIKKEWDVITAGDVFVDIVLSGFPAWPQPGEEVFAGRLHREAGGGAAITACGLAKLGERVAMLAAVADRDGAWLISRLSDCGVGSSLIHHSSVGETGLTISITTAEDRAFFTYSGVNAQLPELLVDPQVWRKLASARHVHLACPMEPDLLVELAAFLHAEGCRLSIDVGWQTAWLKSQHSLNALREIDFFFPNEREGQLMTGEAEPEAVLQALDEAGLRNVALKLGEQGSMLLHRNEIIRCEPYLVIPVDTTGAGDSFNAGFIFAWLKGETPMKCLQTGNVCGALSTRGPGGIANFPTRDELLGVLRV
jgi:sugar/nucleoside kinase (ribokinase family)